MPAQRFFAMLEAGRQLQTEDLIDACDVQSIAVGNPEYYEKRRAAYAQRLSNHELMDQPDSGDESKKLLSGTESKNALIGIFG